MCHYILDYVVIVVDYVNYECLCLYQRQHLPSPVHFKLKASLIDWKVIRRRGGPVPSLPPHQYLWWTPHKELIWGATEIQSGGLPPCRERGGPIIAPLRN